MGVFLAPMAGVTDLAFRLIAREFGADLVVSEMVSAQALVYGNQRTFKMLESESRERPVAIQLFGHKPEVMAEAAQIVVSHCHPDMIDLNFGCPTPKIVKNGDGAALLREPALVGEIVSAVVKASSVPVTAKIRLGWDEDSINCVEVAQRAADAGAHWVTLHARTRNQFYAGKADWNWIRRVVETCPVPVVGNGDVFSAADAKRMLEETGCAHIAIGRGAQGNPWIFRDVQAVLRGESPQPPPSTAERIQVAWQHLELKAEYDGVPLAVREMRPHLAWYLKGVPNSAEIRGKLNSASSMAEVRELLISLLPGK